MILGKRCLSVVSQLQRLTCQRCRFQQPEMLKFVLLKSLQSTEIQQCKTYATAWTRRMLKQKQLEDTVYQYAGKNTNRTRRVYVWGYAATGALGVKKFMKPEKGQKPRKHQLNPYRFPFWEENKLKVENVACGYGFTVFLCKDEMNNGQQVLYGTGINTDSQLGFQESPKNSGRIVDYVIEPAQIPLPLDYPDSTQVLQVACGRAHTFVITDKEGVFSLGNNAYGQCGRPIIEGETFRGSKIINRVALDAKVKQIECGQDHTFFLTEDGQLYSCGLGGDGQTGVGNFEQVGKPQKVIGDIEGENIVQVSSKVDSVLALSDKGEVFGWGNSEYRQFCSVEESTQLCVAKKLPFDNVGRVKKVAAAGSSCALLNDQGQVYVWGYGILGKGPAVEECLAPARIPPAIFGQTDFNASVTVEDITCSISHFAAITSQGDLYMWGRNNLAALGLGHINDQFFPYKVHVPAEVEKVHCGVDHTVALCQSFA